MANINGYIAASGKSISCKDTGYLDRLPIYKGGARIAPNLLPVTAGTLAQGKLLDLAQPAQAYIVPNYYSDLYSRVLVIPHTVNLGSISTEQVLDVHVWNANRHTVNLTKVDIQDGEGITLTGSQTPLTLRALALKKWTVKVSMNGPAEIDCTVTFTIAGKNPVNPVALLYRGMPPSQTVKVMIMRLHYQEQELRVVWIGTIIEAKRPDVHKTELVSAGLSSTMQSAGLRLTWGRNCPYTLYDYDCRVNPKNFAVAGLVIKALNGTTITVDVPENLPEGWFNAGFIEWTDSDGVREVRAVTVHKNNQITLMGGTQKLSIGTTINVYPGCDGRATTCLNKFNNMLNFGGIPHMPNKSPYDGSRVF